MTFESELETVVGQLMAYEARVIGGKKDAYTSEKRRMAIMEPILQRYGTPESVYELFDKHGVPYDEKTVKRIAVEYLNMQIEIAGEYNKTFETLKGMILDGTYSFEQQ